MLTTVPDQLTFVKYINASVKTNRERHGEKKRRPEGRRSKGID
jgi:hypothetical protein